MPKSYAWLHPGRAVRNGGVTRREVPISNNLKRQIKMGKVFTKKRLEKMTDDTRPDGNMTEGKMTQEGQGNGEGQGKGDGKDEGKDDW